MTFIGEGYALAAAILWSFSSFLFTAVSRRIGSIALNINRMITASILLAGTMCVAGISFQISRNQLIYLSLSGIIGLVIGDTFLFRAYKDIGPRITMLIMSFNPAIAAILAFFVIDEGLSLVGVLGIVITLIGISIVVLERENNNSKFKISSLGIIFGFIAAAGQGTGLVVAKMAFLEGDINGITATFYRIITAVLVLIPTTMLMKRFSNPITLFYKDSKALWMVLAASIIGPYLGIFFSFEAIRHTIVGVASTLMSTTPIIILPLTYIFYKEKPTIKSVSGAIIAVIGVAVLVFLK